MSILERWYLALHQFVYRRRKARQVRFPDKYVVSIGNLSAGGTGKTPTAVFLAEHAPAPVIVVLRGYKGRAPAEGLLAAENGKPLTDVTQSGDEALLIGTVGDIRVAVGADRARVISNFAAGREIVLLDDAFQNPSVFRDHELVLLDASIPLDQCRLIPVGRFREPLAALSRAHTVLLTRADQCSDISQYLADLSPFMDPRRIFLSVHAPAGLIPRIDPPGPVGAFCGIGNPGTFFQTLERLGFTVADRRVFPDHYNYKNRDIASLKKSELPWITTEKDWVRLGPRTAELAGMWVHRLLIRLSILNGRSREFVRAVYGNRRGTALT